MYSEKNTKRFKSQFNMLKHLQLTHDTIRTESLKFERNHYVYKNNYVPNFSI